MVNTKNLTVALKIMAFDQASGPIRGIAAVMDKIGASAYYAAKRVKPLTDQLDKLKDYGEAMAKHALIPGGVMAAGLAATVKDFANFEAGRADLLASTMKKGGVFDKLQNSALLNLAEKFGKDYAGSSLDFYRTFRILTEQGISAVNILNGVGKAVADFATVTHESYERVGFTFSKFHDSLGILAKDMPQFANDMQKARFAFGLNTEELYTSLPYLSAGLKSLHMQGIRATHDVLQLIGMQVKGGMKAEEAGTSSEQLLNRLADFKLKMQRNSKAMQEIRRIMSGTGIQFNFFDKMGQFLGFENMISQLEKINKLNPQKAIEVGKYVFGDTAKRSVAIFAEKGVAGWREAGKAAWEEQAEIGERVNFLQNTALFKWNSMTGTLRNFRAQVGETVSQLVAFKQITDKINDAFGTATKGMKEHQLASELMVGGTVGVAGFFLGIGAIGAGIAATAKFASFAIKGWVQAFAVLKTLTGYIRLNLAAMRLYSLSIGTTLGVITAAGAAIASWGLVAYQVWKHWNTLKAPGFFKDLWRWIHDETMLGAFLQWGESLINNIWIGIKNKAYLVINFLKDLLNPMSLIRSATAVSLVASPMASHAAVSSIPISNLAVHASSSGGVHTTYAPQISISGDAAKAKEDFAKMLWEHSREIERINERAAAQFQRKRF